MAFNLQIGGMDQAHGQHHGGDATTLHNADKGDRLGYVRVKIRACLCKSGMHQLMSCSHRNHPFLHL
jgi:hypothetical protein